MSLPAPARGEVPGLSLWTDWVSVAEEEALMAAIDEAPWSSDLSRRVQHYGWRYVYAARRLDASARLGPLPGWAEGLISRLAAEGLGSPDQAIVNEYLPGQGISRHIDHRTHFGPIVLSLSLLSACVMDLVGPEGRRVALPLPRRSLLVLSGEARRSWSHAIPSRASDLIDGVRVARQRRVSVTFRTVLIETP